MVKISFQAVSGQKVEKESDGDKTEILIPHPMVSEESPVHIQLIISVHHYSHSCVKMILM